MRNANKVFALVLLLLASSLSAQQVNLTWDPSPSTCSGLGYNVYRSMTAGTYAGPPVNTKLIMAAPTAAAPFVDSTVQRGLTYFYIVKTSCSGLESAPSNEVTAKVADARILPSPEGLTSTGAPDGKTVPQPAANLEIVFVSPTASVVPVRQTTTVTVQTSGPVSGIWFYINDTLKDSKAGSTLRYNWRPEQRGSYTL